MSNGPRAACRRRTIAHLLIIQTRQIIVRAMFAPAGPPFAHERSYFVGQPAQEMGMPRKIDEEARLEYLPDARYLVYFAAVERMLGAGRVGPTVAHIEISQAFDGDSLFRHGLRQGMGIFIGRLRAARRETRPVR